MGLARRLYRGLDAGIAPKGISLGGPSGPEGIALGGPLSCAIAEVVGVLGGSRRHSLKPTRI